MLIISAGTPDYGPMMAEARRRSERMGYRYTSEPLEKSADLTGAVPPATFKPGVALRGLERAMPGELCAWIDADAVPVRRLDHLESLDFDIAVTLRAPEEIGRSMPSTNYLNSGVLLYRANCPARDFLYAWQQATEAIGGDQAALNHCVGDGWSDRDWKASFGATVIGAAGARVLILDAREWNCWTFPAPSTARILHFKHGLRAAGGANWWREQLWRAERIAA